MIWNETYQKLTESLSLTSQPWEISKAAHSTHPPNRLKCNGPGLQRVQLHSSRWEDDFPKIDSNNISRTSFFPKRAATEIEDKGILNSTKSVIPFFMKISKT